MLVLRNEANDVKRVGMGTRVLGRGYSKNHPEKTDIFFIIIEISGFCGCILYIDQHIRICQKVNSLRLCFHRHIRIYLHFLGSLLFGFLLHVLNHEFSI